jgi:hypothetical protein
MWYQKHNPLVVVSGPRLYTWGGYVEEMLYQLLGRDPRMLPIIRQGGAQGVDAFARRTAVLCLWPCEPSWKPQYQTGNARWNSYAPLKRTENMLDGVEGPESPTMHRPADLLVVFRHGPELEVGGTGHAVREARKRRIPIVVFETQEEVASEPVPSEATAYHQVA